MLRPGRLRIFGFTVSHSTLKICIRFLLVKEGQGLQEEGGGGESHERT